MTRMEGVTFENVKKMTKIRVTRITHPQTQNELQLQIAILHSKVVARVGTP